MINVIQTGFPKQSNKKIINNLLCSANWKFGSDLILPDSVRKDAGFILTSLDKASPIVLNDYNIYAEIIVNLIQEKSFFKFKNIKRIFWNWYHPNSEMDFHQDDYSDKNFSIVYNLHDNDGGTEFKINDKIKFYQSNESEALVFPSKLFHRGISPKTKFHRFSLNMITEI